MYQFVKLRGSWQLLQFESGVLREQQQVIMGGKVMVKWEVIRRKRAQKIKIKERIGNT